MGKSAMHSLARRARIRNPSSWGNTRSESMNRRSERPQGALYLLQYQRPLNGVSVPPRRLDPRCQSARPVDRDGTVLRFREPAMSSIYLDQPLELRLVDDRDAKLLGLVELAAGLVAGQ